MHINENSPFNFAEAVIDKLTIKNKKLFVFVFNVQVIDDIELNFSKIKKCSFISHCLLIYSFNSLTYSYEESRKIPKKNRECIGDTFKINSGKVHEFWLEFEEIEFKLEKNSLIRMSSFKNDEIISFNFSSLNNTL